MIIAITLAYLAVVWLVYFRLKLLPFNLTNKIGVTLAGVVIVLGLWLATNYSHPHSSDVRVYQSVIPISVYLPRPAQVVEVPVEPNTPVKKGEVLFRVDARPFEYEVRRLEAALAAANTDLPKLEADAKAAREAVASSTAKLDYARSEYKRYEGLRATQAVSADEYQRAMAQYLDADAAVRQATAQQERADLALESKVGGTFTSVARVQGELAQARLNLREATVTAPEDGFVVNLAVRPGLMVAPGAPAMTFVSTAQRGVVVATYSQHPLGNIAPGERAEVIFAMHPGRVFKAEVETVIAFTGRGQSAVTADLPNLDAVQPKGRFAVRLTLSDEDMAVLPGGAAGSAVVYTHTLRPLGAVQKMGIRIEGYLNYLTGMK